MEFLEINTKNLSTSLLQMDNFIHNRNLKGNNEDNITVLKSFGHAAWSFILSIYKARWDLLIVSNGNKIFRETITSKFMPKINNNKPNKPNKRVETSNKDKQAKIVQIPSSIPFRPSKKILEKYKFFKKKSINSKENTNLKNRQLYVQTTFSKVREILKLKENFSSLSAKN